MRPIVRVKRLTPGARLPRAMSARAAGLDLSAALERPLTLAPGERSTVPTGVAMAIPEGYEGQVRPRSGLASRHGLTCLNAPGTIDSDYRGQVHVILANLGQEPYTVHDGERIAQLVIAPVARPEILAVDELDETERGEGGFGSTGGRDGADGQG